MATPYMNLTLPTVSVTAGSLYATENNTAFTTIDSHNHTSGQGAQVPTLGININANLSFATYYALQLGNARFVNQVSPLATASDINCVYFTGGNLYANDSAGNQIQITLGGTVNSAPGNINGMGATTASVTYTIGNTTFTFWSNNNVPATLDIGALVIRESGATSPNGVTLQSAAGLAASYALTLPATIAATNNALVMSSNAGVLSYLSLGSAAALPKVNSAGNALGYLAKGSAYQVLQVNSGGSDLTYASVSRNNLSAVGQQVSASCAGLASTTSTSYVDVTNLTITITTSGRPVYLIVQSDGTGTSSTYIGMTNTSAGAGIANYKFVRDSTDVAFYTIICAIGGASNAQFWNTMSYIDIPTAGTYTYKVQYKVSGASMQANCTNMKLFAYEL